MPVFSIPLPDGTTQRVDAPKGWTYEEVREEVHRRYAEYIQEQRMAAASRPLEQPPMH